MAKNDKYQHYSNRSMDDMAIQDLTNRVKSVLIATSYRPDLTEEAIQLDTNLIVDLGFTSITFLDLAIGLEDSLSIDDFPLQEFIEKENERGREGFKVKALIETCRHLVVRRQRILM